MSQSLPTESYDCAVVGGGPGGLTAAIYLARFNRQVVLFNAGEPRALWSPWNRNYPGFPDGLSGADLVGRFAEQAAEFGVTCVPERVEEVSGSGECFQLRTNGRCVEARRVILATGVQDRWPQVPGWKEMAGTRIRTCPICDAYESNQVRVGLMGSGDRVAREALYLTTFTSRLVLFTIGLREERRIDPALLARLQEERIPVVDAPLTSLTPHGEEGVCIHLEDGSEWPVDRLFTALGCRVNNELATALGAEVDEDGYLITDRQGQTTVPGLYAVGDVTTSINQVTVAVGQAAVAATNAHNSLLDF